MTNVHVVVIRSVDDRRIAVFEAVDMAQADAWIASESPKWDAPGGFQVIKDDMTSTVAQQRANQEALNYLASTDWYVIRKMDTGIAVPEEIEKLRQEARERIVRS